MNEVRSRGHTKNDSDKNKKMLKLGAEVISPFLLEMNQQNFDFEFGCFLMFS